MNAKVISVMQGLFLVVGSVLFGFEFGWRIGLAIWFVGYALTPISTRTS